LIVSAGVLMYTEIEAKLKVDAPQELERKLADLGAEFLAEQLQTDYHFDDSKAGFSKSDRCLRLRRQLVGGVESFFLTYKGAREKGSFKRRREIEIEVNDSESLRSLLSELGYEEVFVLEKKRRVWRLGCCSVALDRLPLLGGFIEIEGPDEVSIADAQRNLGLSDLPHIPGSYVSLMKAELGRLGRHEKGFCP
jgi:adenylate cyclase class 2